MVCAAGDKAVFDLYLLNDTGEAVSGKLTFAMTDPLGQRHILGVFPTPHFAPNQFSALIQPAFATPVLEAEGLYRFSFSLSDRPNATQTREILVSDARLAPQAGKTLKIATANVAPNVRSALERLNGISLQDFTPGGDHAAIVASTLNADVIAAVKKGTPLLVMAQDDDLADAAAHVLAAEGAFTYAGQVGKIRAPWMGNWYFLRAHPAYDGLPVNQAMGAHSQVPGKPSNGLLVDGTHVDVFAGYSRDHDRQVGAGTFTTRLGAGKILFQRVPDLNGPMQQRFLRNALAWLCTA
jgi:hypothetical protein